MNTSRDALLNIENWQRATFDEQANDNPSTRRRRKGVASPDATALRPADATVSPLDLYVYLKARFGPPNDVMMVARAPGLENLIQWGYALTSGGHLFRLHGTSGRVEFIGERLPPDGWRALIAAIKQDFARFGQQMKEVRQSLTRWSLFINPFRRVQMTVFHFAARLRSFEILEPGPSAMAMTQAEAEAYDKAFAMCFDGLPARAAIATDVPIYEVGLDSVERLGRYTPANGILAVSMHGDYRYDQLKNTVQELQQADEAIRAHFVTHLRDTSLLVIGYSGRDDSVMKTMAQAYEKPGPGALYWCGYADAPSDRVAELIRIARATGRTAHFVQGQGFDDLLWRLCVQSLPHEDQPRVRQLAASLRAGPRRSPFDLPQWPATGFIKSDAFAVEMPAELFEVELTAWPEEITRWAYADQVAASSDVVAAPFKGKLLALGTADGVKAALGKRLKAITRTPIGEEELGYEDGVVMNLLRTALARSMAQVAGIRFDGRALLSELQPIDSTRANGALYSIYEAAHCSLRRIGGATYVVLKPTLLVADAAGLKAPKEISQPIVVQRLGYQHNDKFNQVMNRWRQTLFSKTTTFEFPPNSAGQFRFVVRKSPVFASVKTKGARAVPIPRELAPHIRQEGVELPEPKLIFGSRTGETNSEESHPIRGITAHYPFDYALTLRGFASSVTLGIICPTSHDGAIARYLNNLHARQATQPADAEYLVDFPGFEGVFRLPINVPQPGESRWSSVAEPAGGDLVAEARSLAANIVRTIEQLHTHGTSVVVIVVPTRWEPWTKIDTDDTKFDLHDFVKAFCVQRGIATQFLRESTLNDPQPCRVMWWLSLALYAKAMRTPWVLRGLSDGTAFVGLGFSLDRSAPRGSHVLLGCSHIYNSRGEGMEYRLSKIENPIMRGKNPFMSQEDAARVGRTIQELYFSARGDLPRRVVIHKQTPFIRPERDGLLDGLRGVDAIDLIEINRTPLRYVASRSLGNGRFDEDRWPVKRGTVVKLDAFSALVWVHGLAAALNPGRKYFQGKRRIPSPLLIRRHVGDTDLVTIAEEILALSKMDWNTFDMYQRYPATLQSSGEIARIGALLQRFGNLSYDYRLFI